MEKCENQAFSLPAVLFHEPHFDKLHKNEVDEHYADYYDNEMERGRDVFLQPEGQERDWERGIFQG